MSDTKKTSVFFESNYAALRDKPPMRWMVRLFEDVVTGKYPRLVDLPTGAGKTELVVIWLLALAWLGANERKSPPVPRRLVWIVNRRVLVRQVFEIASTLREKMEPEGAPEMRDVRAGLRAITGTEGDVFQVVELRGQIAADRDWAIRPAMPQLIIGTVDQIGSRLLFQGYGLGKWGRPQQAGLLGVDAWVTVDEAHLVPAFVVTLRQLRDCCGSPAANLPAPFDALFARLPFWLTELSATPGLPPPSQEKPFRLTEDDKADEAIADRILAAKKRRVLVEWLPKAEKPKEVLAQKLVAASIASKAARIAVFVREVWVANAVAKGIAAELKKGGINEARVCKITGRIRGYERDRLSEEPAFKVFLSERQQQPTAVANERHFLVGTAAAEVGLDADADVILCDFASLPTLLQRLGRLDRRGVMSRRHDQGNGELPTMRVFASREEPTQKILGQLSKLATALNADSAPWSAELMAGAHWLSATKTKEDKADEKEEKSAKDQTTPLIDAATWKILNPTEGVCTPSKDWLAHDHARIAAGPVVVPPLTDAVLDYFSATTEPRSPHLSPHPFLYGLADEDEGTPLVGVAFRLEVEALRETADDEDDTETPDAAADVIEIFKRFPPLRAELHQVKLSVVREWLDSAAAEEHPLVYRKRDKWHAKVAGESTAAAAAALGPDGVLILPASVRMHEPCKKLLEDCEQPGGADGKHTVISDVLLGVSDPQRARYLRSIEPSDGLVGSKGAFLWNTEAEDEKPSATAKPKGFNQALSKKLSIGGVVRVSRYYRPNWNSGQLQYLDAHDGAPGHIARAQGEAVDVAKTIAPGDTFLSSLLSAAALGHDEGKRFPKWQRAFGWRTGMPPIAKLVPGLEKPASLKGFRHEWESLRELTRKGATSPAGLSPEAQALWRDLLLHLVGVHHGHLRPSITDNGLTPNAETAMHNPLRLEAAERFARLQNQLGHWRLAYLEALLKTADAEGSRDIPKD